MGEYADDACLSGLDECRGQEGEPLWGRSPIDGKQRIACAKCGYAALYWRKTPQGWRLHHWTMFGKMQRPEFVLHRCGFQSDGTPKPSKEANPHG